MGVSDVIYIQVKQWRPNYTAQWSASVSTVSTIFISSVLSSPIIHAHNVEGTLEAIQGSQESHASKLVWVNIIYLSSFFVVGNLTGLCNSGNEMDCSPSHQAASSISTFHHEHGGIVGEYSAGGLRKSFAMAIEKRCAVVLWSDQWGEKFPIPQQIPPWPCTWTNNYCEC